MSRRLSAETRAASVVAISSLLVSCNTQPIESSNKALDLSTPTPEATPTQPSYPEDTRITIVPEVIVIDLDGKVINWVDSNPNNSCQILSNEPDANAYASNRPEHEVLGHYLGFLGYHSSDKSGETRDIEAFCKELGIEVSDLGEFFNTYKPGVYQARPAGRKNTERVAVSAESLRLLLEIQNYYDGIPYKFTARDFASLSLDQGETLADPGYVELAVPEEYLSDASIILNVGYTILGDKGTAYLRRIEWETCGGAFACYFFDSGIISVSRFYPIYDNYTKRGTAIHEFMHLLTAHCTKYLYTFEDSMRLEEIMHRMLFRYDPLEVYDDLYADMDSSYSNWNPLWMVSNEFVLRHEELGWTAQTPGLELIFQKYNEFSGDGFSKLDYLRLGRVILSQMIDHPEIEYPPELVSMATEAYRRVITESFAMVGEVTLQGDGSKYATNPENIADLEEFLSIVNGQPVSVPDLIQKLRYSDGILPYKLVPIETP